MDAIAESIATPENAPARARKALGLDADAPLAISYLPGPGDVAGTFHHWKRREFDPRIPSIPYSTMFLELCARLGARAHLIQRTAEEATSIEEGSVRIDKIPFQTGRGALGYIAARARYSRDCIRAVNAAAPDLVVVSSDFVWRALPMLCRGRKSILTVHNTLWPMGETDHPLKRQVKLAALARWLRAVDSAIFTSSECERQINALAGGRFRKFVAAPQQIVAPKADGALKPSGQTTVVYVGRIEINKGVLDLVDAFEKLAADRPAARLVMIGDGGADEALRNRIHTSPARDAIEQRGRLHGDAVHDALAKADILACPTQRAFDEGLAFVCFEAAAHGVPSVMSEVVPARDLLSDACVVAPAEDPIALADALSDLMDDPERLATLKARAKEKSAVLYDRSRSWGSQLWNAIESLAAP